MLLALGLGALVSLLGAPPDAATAGVEIDGSHFVVAAAAVGADARGAIRVRVLAQRELADQLDDFATAVADILGDDAGWSAAGRRFVVVDQRADIDVVLARPKVVDALCRPLRTGGAFSCGRNGRAVINATRWRRGAATFARDLEGYRTYVINHEVGHLLGFAHATCKRRGGPAPIMLQQTKTLSGCRRSMRPSALELERFAANARFRRTETHGDDALPPLAGASNGRLLPP